MTNTLFKPAAGTQSFDRSYRGVKYGHSYYENEQTIQTNIVNVDGKTIVQINNEYVKTLIGHRLGRQEIILANGVVMNIAYNKKKSQKEIKEGDIVYAEATENEIGFTFTSELFKVNGINPKKGIALRHLAMIKDMHEFLRNSDGKTEDRLGIFCEILTDLGVEVGQFQTKKLVNTRTQTNKVEPASTTVKPTKNPEPIVQDDDEIEFNANHGIGWESTIPSFSDEHLERLEKGAEEVKNNNESKAKPVAATTNKKTDNTITEEMTENGKVVHTHNKDNELIQSIYYDKNDKAYKKDVFTKDTDGYTKTSYKKRGALWQKHGHEVSYDKDNKVVSKKKHIHHEHVHHQVDATVWDVYAENFADGSYLKDVEKATEKFTVLHVTDLSISAIETVQKYILDNPDKFAIDEMKVINHFKSDVTEFVVPLPNIKKLDLSEAEMPELRNIDVPNSHTEFDVKIKGNTTKEIDFSGCGQIEKLTVEIQKCNNVESIKFPPKMTELVMVIDHPEKLKCIDLSAYPDLKVTIKYLGHAKDSKAIRAKHGYCVDFTYEKPEDLEKAVEQMNKFEGVQTRKVLRKPLGLILHPDHPVNKARQNVNA